jgi:hypothetical protein
MSTCPLSELIEQFRKTGKKALDENDFIRGMVFNSIAHRLERCETLLTEWQNIFDTDAEATDDLIERTRKELGSAG